MSLVGSELVFRSSIQLQYKMSNQGQRDIFAIQRRSRKLKYSTETFTNLTITIFYFFFLTLSLLIVQYFSVGRWILLFFIVKYFFLLIVEFLLMSLTSSSVWNFSENSSVLETPSFPYLTFKAVPPARNGICRRDIYRKLLHHYSRPGGQTEFLHDQTIIWSETGKLWNIFHSICIIHP